MSASRTITVAQGDIRLSRDGRINLSTVLGSCIAVCLFDPLHGIGGMTHYLLPTPLSDSPPSERSGLHGPSAIRSLHADLALEGALTANLQAKIVGGGAVVQGLCDIGRDNIQCAVETLSALGIPIIARCVGGDRARKVRFHPATGRIHVQKLPASLPLNTPNRALHPEPRRE